MEQRFKHDDLITCTSELFGKAGLDAAIARVVAEILVEADLLGYDTHGLQFVPSYLAAVEAGRMTAQGEPEILQDHGSALLLDGIWLPGQWVVVWALETALERIKDTPVVTISIRRAQNISCLATYVKRVADLGYLALLMASGPSNAAVAPHGGVAARYSTDPLAVGIPAGPHPILIDTATSSTTNREVERRRRDGSLLPFPALVNSQGQPSDDPNVLTADPPGAILPAGGAESGHKGFAFALMVEALTSALCGWGRAKGEEAGGNNVFLQVINPEGFGGLEAFREEASWLANECRETAPRDPAHPVRMPGDRAAAVYSEQMKKGVLLHPEILPRMLPLLEKYSVAAPIPL